ncbi:hypothetical protein BGZ72_000001, partial [Mortierella alpina]
LINEAFKKGNDAWRLDWIEARLQYIEVAENLSYHIPGFRQTYSWFPKEIYFCSTAQEVKDKGETTKGEGGDSSKNDLAVKDLKDQVQNLKDQLTAQQDKEEQRFEQLKDLLVLALSKNNRTEAESNT